MIKVRTLSFVEKCLMRLEELERVVRSRLCLERA